MKPISEEVSERVARAVKTSGSPPDPLTPADVAAARAAVESVIAERAGDTSNRCTKAVALADTIVANETATKTEIMLANAIRGLSQELLLALAGTQAEWVKCSDEMPPLETQVLVNPAAQNGVEFSIATAYWNGREWHHDNWNADAPREHFTHWMTLPAGPACPPASGRGANRA